MKVKDGISIALGIAVVCIFTVSIFLFIHGALKSDSVEEIESDSIVENITDNAKKMIEQKEKEKIEKTEEKKKENNPKIVSLGEFRLTAYCDCKICCGQWSGSPTASGVMPRANHTIAVDTSVIPFGTEVMINGQKYVAEDTGSVIKGNRIDIFFNSHQTALNFGVQYAEVFKVVK